MKRAWAAAIAAVVALAAGIGVADGSGSGSTLGVAYVTATATSAPVVWLAHADGRHARLLGRGSQPHTSETWLVTLASGRAIPLGIDHVGAALSRDGGSALVDRGGFLNPPDHGVVESLPLDGGKPRVLASHGSEPSWDE